MKFTNRTGGAAVGILLLGAVLGHCATPDTVYHTQTKYKVIHVTDTKEVPGPTVTVHAAPPEACRTAIRIGHGIMSAGQQYERTAADLIDILGEIRQNSVTGDPNTANDITDRLNELTPSTIHASQVLGTVSTPFFAAATTCLNAYKEQ